MIDERFDYPEYLAIKQAIDDKSLNPAVWQTLATALKPDDLGQDLKILEIGAGTGSMIIRLLNSGLLHQCQYFAVEREADFAPVAEHELSAWARSHGYKMDVAEPTSWTLKGHGKQIEIHWVSTDILELSTEFDPGTFSLLIGHAVIDLLPVPECMPGLLQLVHPGGGYYFSLNFAGLTSFSPPDPRDDEITAAYHRDMDMRFPGVVWRASQTGQILGDWLKEQGHRVLAEGDSHWQLSTFPSPTAMENRFIGNILETMEKALAGREGLEDWLRLRRQQAASGTLRFFASNRDFFGRTCALDTPQGKESNQKNNHIA